MDNKENIEILDEKPVENKVKDNKNSVILMFAILAAIIFMIIIAAALYLVPSLK